MKSPRGIAALALVAAAVFACPCVGGQNPAPAPAQAPQGAPANPQAKPGQVPTIRRTVEEVIVPVTVKDRNGNLVADLKKDEFRVFEDDVEQKIMDFKTEAFPISVVV